LGQWLDCTTSAVDADSSNVRSLVELSTDKDKDKGKGKGKPDMEQASSLDMPGEGGASSGISSYDNDNHMQGFVACLKKSCLEDPSVALVLLGPINLPLQDLQREPKWPMLPSNGFSG